MEDLLVTGLVYLELHVPEASSRQIPPPGRELFVPALPVRLGGALNAASVLRAFKAPVRLATPVGSGSIGRLVQGAARDLRLPLLEWPATTDGSVSLVLHGSGDRAFLSAADFAALELVTELPAARWIHVPGLREAAALRPALALARMRGSKISLSWSWSPEGLASVLGDSPLGCDLIVMNELEATQLAGGPEEALRTLGPRAEIVAVTLGANGALASHHGQLHRVPAPRVQVVDPTGAGDAFSAGLLAARHRGLGVETALQWGTEAASRVLGIYGGVLEGTIELESRAET